VKNIMQYLHEILTLIGEDRPRLPSMVMLFLGVSILDLAGLGLIAPYIALVIQPDLNMDGRIGQLLAMLNWNTDRETLLFLLSGILATLFICKSVIAISINNVTIRFAQNQEIRLRSRLMHFYQQLRYSVYLQRNSAEYVHSVEILTGHFQALLQQILRMLSDVLVVLVILGLLIFENAIALSLLLLLVGGNLLVYDSLFRKRMRDYGLRSNQAEQSMVKGIHEGLEGLKEIRVLGQEAYFHRTVRLGAEALSFNQRRYQLINLAPRYLLEAVLVVFVLLLVLLTMRLETSTEVLIGTLGLFGVASIRILPMTNNAVATLNTLRFSRDSVSRLYADVKDLPQTSERIDRVSDVEEPFSSLILDDVGYSYPNSKVPALQGLSLKIQAGESIGLIGPSGSGKTTLVDVLLGLLKPQSGTLKFNGRSLQEKISKWRSQVAYLPQQVFLIDNTLKHNVALGEEDQEIDEQRLAEAIRKARLTELVAQLPQGENTLVGERGVRLSGGQRQRVALARAFYHGRSVLVMDEATSALDDSTEKKIVGEIKHLKGQKTMIVIAHRLTTVKDCDRIYRLEQGRIVEEGCPQQVLTKVS
jgi:ATP-binding cassette, subfamily B, bacterial PglK